MAVLETPLDSYNVKKHESHWGLAPEGGLGASICESSKEELLAAMQVFGLEVPG